MPEKSWKAVVGSQKFRNRNRQVDVPGARAQSVGRNVPRRPPNDIMYYEDIDMQDYKTLHVWQRSHKLVLDLYRATQTFPPAERYGLTSQLRRAALSVPTNIAEGSRRAAPREYSHFLNTAQGSLSETEYLVLVSRDLGYIRRDFAEKLLSEAIEVLKILSALRKKVHEGMFS